MKRSIDLVFSGLFGLGVLAASAGANAQPTAPEPPPPPAPWYEAIHLGAFADAYGGINYNLPKPETGTNKFRAYDTTNGFALSWVGLDASYDPAPVGGTVGLRLGPTAQTYAGDDANYDLQYVKQAYASWKPFDMLQLDFGKFDTIYGAEVAESQNNMNYTRGALYWLAQPLFHTGLRANIAVAPMLSFNVLAVNGWNNTIDNNTGKSYGVQAVLSPTDTLGISLGWIGGPEQSDTTTVDCAEDFVYDPGQKGCAPAPGTAAATYTVDRGGANDLKAWKHLIDLVASFDATENLSFVLNADYGTEGVRSIDPELQTVVDHKSWYGAMLGARYQLTPVWAVAGRGEYYKDPQGYTTGTGYDISLATGTLTIEAKPTDNLILRLENRGDFVVDAATDQGKKVFLKKVRDSASNQLTTTLGVVVTTN